MNSMIDLSEWYGGNVVYYTDKSLSSSSTITIQNGIYNPELCITRAESEKEWLRRRVEEVLFKAA